MIRNIFTFQREPSTCISCGKTSLKITSALKMCYTCLIRGGDQIFDQIKINHQNARTLFALPGEVPKHGGRSCKLCAVECEFGDDALSWCGLRGVENQTNFSKMGKNEALLEWYLDPHVTNCCNSWFCPAGTGSGYPKYAYKKGAERGYVNLSLFLYGCSFNCLFCQNYQHKKLANARITTEDEIIQATLNNEKISCWCWFGGSPEPQFPFTLRSSKRILEEKPEERIVRICYEWNGFGNPNLVKKAGKLAFESGGNIKFDFKAYDPIVHQALTGCDSTRVKENIELIFNSYWDKRDIPVLGITTLLVPYYVNEREVENIAKFLADLSPDIPYSLLVFHPDFMMHDMPITPYDQVKKCEAVANKYLNNVNVGNKNLIIP